MHELIRPIKKFLQSQQENLRNNDMSSFCEDLVNTYNGDFEALSKILFSTGLLNKIEIDRLRIRFCIWQENVNNPFPFCIESLEEEWGHLGTLDQWMSAIKDDQRLNLYKCKIPITGTEGYLVGCSVTDISEYVRYVREYYWEEIEATDLVRVV